MPLPVEYLPASGAMQQELVLLHGWGCNREVWRPLLTLLRPWANITLLDLPGCAPGVRWGKEPDLPGVLADILEGCPEQAVYLGWSLGGQLAIELAVREPQRVLAVVTVCSNPRFVATDDWPGMDADDFSEFHSGVQADPVAALRRFDSLQVTGSKQPRQLLRQLHALPRQRASAELLAGLGWLQMLDQRHLLTVLQQPQLHLLAARDALVPRAAGQSIASRLAGVSSGQVRVLPETSHLLPLDAPAQLAQDIHGFLASTGMLGRHHPVAPEREKKSVAASFSRAAAVYDSFAHLQREVGERLLTRLDPLHGAPAAVLDLGCGTGYFCPALKTRFPDAHYLGLDLAAGMVDYARGCRGEDSAWLVADAEALPLASASIDLVFSSLAVQWCSRPEHLFAELARVLRPGGCCVFTTLGPDTLCELRSAWAAVDTHQHVNTFLPMSALQAAADCVPGIQLKLEGQALRMEYMRVRDLLDELKALGAHNMNRSRPSGLTSRRALQGMLQAYESWRTDGVLPATYEVIFGVLEKA
jgi:malonyl-CoA O-methyltransferase